MTDLRAEKLSLAIDGKPLVKEVSLKLSQGELVVMLGPNGAGKSLTLKAAIGLEKLATGLSTLGGDPIQTLTPMTRARQLTYLPQTRALAWPIRTRDLVALGRFAYGTRLGKLSPADTAAVEHAMQACDISHLADRKASTLSGGELARTHCARVFAAKAPLLIADEPVAALDPRHQFGVMDLFRNYVQDGGGALIVLHDIALAAKYADRLIWMKDGEIITNGTPDETLTPERLANVYGIKASIDGRKVEIEGRV